MDKTRTVVAEDMMATRLFVFSPDASVKDATHMLLRQGISGAPVMGPGGMVLGVFSEYDSVRSLTQAVYADWPSGSVSDHMTRKVVSVPPDADLAAIAGRLTADGAGRRVLVMDGEKLVGIITRRDLMRAFDHMLERARPRTTYELISARR